MENNSQVWSITKLGLSLTFLLEEKQCDVVWHTKLRRMKTELSTASRIAWWQKDIPKNQESTIVTPSRLLNTRSFSNSSLLLPCIFDVNFFSWTSIQPIYMEAWKKPYTWSNKRTLMMDQVRCVYLKIVCMAGKSIVLSPFKFPEIDWCISRNCLNLSNFSDKTSEFSSASIFCLVFHWVQLWIRNLAKGNMLAG